MIHCIAIDDEPKALEVVKNHASRIDFLDLEATFLDPFQALTYLLDKPVDLVFLDIQMPLVNGVELVKHFAKKPLIVFTTAHSDYAIQSYEVEAVDYLLKPFDFPRFLQAVTRVKERLASAPGYRNAFFFVNTGNQKQRLVYDEIYFVEGEGNYVRYVTKGGNVLVRSSIRETAHLLPDSGFIQIHRSYLVSLSWIEKIEDNHVFIAGRRLPIGATYRGPFLKVIDGLNYQ